jgi:hypothetical protein
MLREIIISPYVRYRIAEFFEYMKDRYTEKMLDSLFFWTDLELIEDYIRIQDRNAEILEEKIYEKLNAEVVWKFMLDTNWSIEEYFTNFRLNNFNVRLTCRENTKQKYVLIEDILITNR